MAHLPDDSLPSQFDVVIDGTGLVQSVLAAALSQAGKSVLHIDRNGYYGEQWASLMHRELNQWIAEHTGQLHNQDPTSPEVAPEVEDGEEIISLRHPSPQARISNVVEIIPDVPEEDPPQPPPPQPTDDQGPPPSFPTSEETTQPPTQDNSGTGGGADAEPVTESEEPEEAESEQGGQGGGTASVEPRRQRLTWQSLESQRRRFNYDVIPKLLYCRGELVNILTRSNCSRYIEFRAVNKIYTQMNGKMEQVPCSRSDVFSSKSVSMLEKRKMMKFLTFCSEFEKHPEEYEEFVSLPYAEFLRRKELTPNLIQYIVHCIAMVNEQVPTLEGLKTTQIFLNSLGRFGNAPFLYPIFGPGELPQAFCRLCAVFGGVYCLRRHIQSLVVSTTTNRVTGIVCSTGQKISCSTVVSSAALLKDTLDLGESVSVARLSRGVFVTDGPIQNTEERLALLTIPPHALGSDQTVAVYLLQLDSSTNNTAEGTFMVHMMCVSVSETAQQDLECVARTLFKMDNQTESNSAGPSLLWSLYYNATVCTASQTQLASLDLPSGVFVTSDPDGTVAYENAMKEAQVLFERMCPGVDFLPQPPDPEDIVYEENPGNEDTNESQQQTPPATTEGGTEAVNNEQTPPSDSGTPAVGSESQEPTPPTATEGGTEAVGSESQEQTPPSDSGTQAVGSDDTNKSQQT